MAETLPDGATWHDVLNALKPFEQSTYANVAEAAQHVRLAIEGATLSPEAMDSPVEAELLPRFRSDIQHLLYLTHERTQS